MEVPPAPASSRPVWPWLLLLLAVVLACLGPGRTAPLFTDDLHQLGWVRGFHSWTEVLGRDVFGFLRPAKNILFKLAAPWEQNLPAWHAFGFATYLLGTLGVFRIALVWMENRFTALLAAVIWALSPTGVSSALWMSCANISLGLFFTAGVVCFHERNAVRFRPGFLLIQLVFLLLSLMCYEPFVAVPAVLLARDFQQGRLRTDKRTLAAFGGLGLVCLGFLVARHFSMAKTTAGDPFHTRFAPGITNLQVFLSAPWFLWRHFSMWVAPFGRLEVLGNYVWLQSASPIMLGCAWGFLAVLAASVVWLWKRMPMVAFGLLFFLLASLPAGNFLPAFNGPIADYYVLVPSVGLALAGADLCARLARRFAEARRLRRAENALWVPALLGIILLVRLPVCALYSGHWAETWTRPGAMLLRAAEARPFQIQPRAMAAIFLLDQGYAEAAEAAAARAATEGPWSPMARFALARTALFRDNLPVAEQNYRYLVGAPDVPPELKEAACFDLASLLALKPESRSEAADLCRSMLVDPIGPRHAKAIGLLAHIYRQQGDAARARATLERGLRNLPGNALLEGDLKALDEAGRKAGP